MQYRKPLHEIVGVITPFGSQVRAIIAACGKLQIKAGHLEEEVTVGTVHSLQGAERTVIIFSPVYSKHANGEFIDKSVSMLNVAVSRAKDSFLVFGDMDVFGVVSKTKPRGLLASLLFQSNAKGLNFEHRRRPDLKTPRTEIRHLRDAQQHDAFLLNALANVGAEIQIVTPWIRSNVSRTSVPWMR